MSIMKRRFFSLAIAGALATTMLAPALATADNADQKPRPAVGAKALKGPDTGATHASDTSGWEVVHEGNLGKVQVTTTDADGNRQTGCSDHDAQVSTPGPC